MAKEEKKVVKVKRPTPLKRDDQAAKRRLINRDYRSRVRTTIRTLDEALEKKDSALSKEKLSEAYSIIDKCVKTGVYKANKGSRTKARLAARAASSLAAPANKK